MMNPNWNRWVFASIGKHFADLAAVSPAITLTIENEEKLLTPGQTGCDLRLTGPEAQQLSKGQWKLDFVINILVVAIKSEIDAHLILRLCGRIQSNFLNCIPVYKYGDTLSDDQSLLGHLQLIPKTGKDIETVHFGQVSPDMRVLQSTVEGHYRIFLEE